MTGRRNANRIRGPQSALTDFLAANNISAAQIRNDFERRQREVDQDTGTRPAPTSRTTTGRQASAEIDEEQQEELEDEEDRVQRVVQRKRNAKAALEKIKKAKALANKHAAKGKISKKKRKGQKDGDEDDSDDGDYDDDFARDMYRKSRPAPGQFEHCELCNKRFTVTPYTKEGSEGGLLCPQCAKSLAKDAKAERKALAPKSSGRKRRKIESDRLDGISIGGAKSLQQLCIAKVAQHHEDIEEFGELPQNILERLSEIFSKQRVMKPKTLPLFLRGDIDAVIIHDAAYLEEDSYHQIFAVVPKMESLVLGNACQFKDPAIDYMLERCANLKSIQLYAANLVSNQGWQKLIRSVGPRLEVLKLKWLDAAFEDAAVGDIADFCPHLNRLKLKLCRRIGQDSVAAISRMQSLQHLSLRLNKEVQSSELINLVTQRGPQLRTLSLENFYDINDSVLTTIRSHCTKLTKLRITHNDEASDAGYVSLFTDWVNPPLHFADFNSTRDVDNSNPHGPENPIGVASSGFKALMAHSGIALRHLDIASCRHIGLSAFMDVFNGEREYPELEYIDLSFCTSVDNSVIAGIFKSCPALKKLVTFCCFGVQDVVVPRSITLIGAPKAQDAIEQFGVGIGVDEAIGRMVETAA